MGVAEGVDEGVGLGVGLGVEVGDGEGVGVGVELGLAGGVGEGIEIGEDKGVNSAGVFGAATLGVSLSSPPESIIEHPKNPMHRARNNAHRSCFGSWGLFISSE